MALRLNTCGLWGLGEQMLKGLRAGFFVDEQICWGTRQSACNRFDGIDRGGLLTSFQNGGLWSWSHLSLVRPEYMDLLKAEFDGEDITGQLQVSAHRGIVDIVLKLLRNLSAALFCEFGCKIL